VTLLALALLAGCWTEPHWPAAAPADRCAAGAIAPGRYVVDAPVPGRRRQGLVWVPRGPGPHDVVVSLHEFRSSPERQAAYSGWQAFADEANVILLAPDGRAATWNAGDCCGKAMEEGTDDVAYLDALVARIDGVGCTSGRVLATGIGNGGMMAERWACASDVPDAVVSVGGSLQVDACDRTRPIPWLHEHGGADRFVPPDGGDGILDGRDPARHRPVAHAVEVWRRRNGATGAPEVIVDGALTCTTWPGGAPTVSCVIAGGPDAWPGAADGKVASGHPLADATRGAWAWVQDAWRVSPP
jgi:polyhydroxybutyrate depolymerase